MSTLTQLVDDTLLNLQGYSLDQDQVTFLTSPVSAADLTISVDQTKEISRGLIEIDDELLWIRSVADGGATIAPKGRGYRSTVAASHDEGAMVTNAPKYPRASVRRAINDTISATFPELFSIKSYEFTFQAARSTYDLPDDVDQVLEVMWSEIGPSQAWPQVRRWWFNHSASSGMFPNGKSLAIKEAVFPGRTVRVIYAAEPGTLVNNNDEFADTTGLPKSAEDVMLYGACYRLVSYMQPARLQVQSVEATLRSNVVSVGSPAEAGQYFYALYQQRLSEERQTLLTRFPSMTHYTRW